MNSTLPSVIFFYAGVEKLRQSTTRKLLEKNRKKLGLGPRVGRGQTKNSISYPIFYVWNLSCADTLGTKVLAAPQESEIQKTDTTPSVLLWKPSCHMRCIRNLHHISTSQAHVPTPYTCAWARQKEDMNHGRKHWIFLSKALEKYLLRIHLTVTNISWIMIKKGIQGNRYAQTCDFSDVWNGCFFTTTAGALTGKFGEPCGCS